MLNSQPTSQSPVPDPQSPSFQQQDIGFLTYPSGGWRKAMFKWPIQLWRLGLAPVIGHHMVLITQTGRKSGLPRHTMTELYDVDGVKYAPSGFGRRSQWVRNIEADPRVTIQTAGGAESVLASRVTDDDEIMALLDHMKGRSSAMVGLYLETLAIEPTREDILAKKDRIYWIRFDPTERPTPPPLPADLIWVLPVVLAGLTTAAVTWLLSRRK